MDSPNIFQKEPAVIIGAVTAVIALAYAFGAPITQEQQEAIIGAVVALIPMIALIRQVVYSPATVQKEVVKAAATGEVPQNMSPPAGSPDAS